MSGEQREHGLVKDMEIGLLKVKSNPIYEEERMTLEEFIEIKAEQRAEERAEAKAQVLAEEKAQVLAEAKVEEKIKEIQKRILREGKQEGIAEGIKRFALRLMMNTDLSDEAIMDTSGLSRSEIIELRRMAAV